MGEPKTQATGASVAQFIAHLAQPARRADAEVLLEMFEQVTGERACMWGESIIGFGDYETTYASGRKVNWMRTGFSPRKAKHSLYLMAGYSDADAARERAELLQRLGKHAQGKSCLYINKLADVDLGVLRALIAADWAAMGRLYPPGEGG